MAEKAVNPVGLGLFLTGSYNWAGGLYYMLNVIKALKEISEEKKIFRIVVLVNNHTPKELIDEINSEIIIVNTDKLIVVKIFSKLSRIFFNKDRLYKYLVEKYNLNYLYPFNDFLKYYDEINSYKVSWIYDFQHKILPEFFSPGEIEKRDALFTNIAEKASKIVFSSNDALKHFKTFYSGNKNTTNVVQFASCIDEKTLPAINEVKKKYEITYQKYFIVSNQFWQHKNHIVVLKAIKHLNEENINMNVIFTGRNHDHRNPDYFQSLQQFIAENNIQDKVKILGFIDRNDQLTLIKNSIALIQPSKFEGWSTVVEDAKALNVPVILSDIAVHKEQIGQSALLFGCDDYIQLSKWMESNSFPLPSSTPVVNWQNFKNQLIETFKG